MYYNCISNHLIYLSVIIEYYYCEYTISIYIYIYIYIHIELLVNKRTHIYCVFI